MARLAAERIDTQNTHGTGCTLSSAIALSLDDSTEATSRWMLFDPTSSAAAIVFGP